MNIFKIVIKLTLILILINTASAVWWDNDYYCRKTITLTGNTSGAQTDYQLLLNVTYDSNMQADFDDLRFRNDTHQIDAWLESKVDSSYALVWVEFPTTPANGVDQDYYMYYGNNDVSSDWDINATFLFGDNFSGSSLDTDKWSIKDGSCSVSGGYAQPYGLPVFVITKTFTASNAVVHVKHIQTSTQGVGMVFRSTDEVRAVADLYITYLRNDNTLSFRKIVNDAPTVFNSTAYTQGAATYKQHITFNGTALNVDIWKNAASDSLNATGDGTRTDGRIGFLNYVNVAEGAFKVDYIFAHKYAANSPTYNFSEDEDTIFLQYNSSIPITNIVAPDNEVWADDENDTDWIVTPFINNVTVVMGTDYDNSTGNFSITDGWVDTFLVRNLTNGDIIILYEDDAPIEVGLVIGSEYTFTTNINIGSYSISIMVYDNVTGIHGFVYEGTSGISNPLESVVIYIYNSTWSDTTVTDNGGYYAFIGLSNTTYTLNFKKDRYKDVLYQYVTPENLSMYYKVIYAQKSTGDYYSRHYVTFTLKNLWQTRYQNIDVVIYNNGNVDSFGITGYDGSYIAHVFEDVEYQITFINDSQSINKEITLQPRDNEYTIYISDYDFSPKDSERGDTVNWWYQKGDLNLTHQWLNFSYRDTTNSTISIKYWINDSDNDNLYYFTQAYPCPAEATYEVNQIVNSSNHTYIVHFSATHPDYPELENSAIQTLSYYTGKLIDLAFTEQWHYTVTAICIIIFIAMFFGATNVGTGSVIICLSAWFFSFIQWLPTSTIGYASLVLATILSVAFAMRKAEVIHT